MSLSCSYIPRNKEGQELKGFQTYKKELGYPTAAKVFTQVISSEFKEDYRKQVELDSQGVPTYQSVVRIPYVKNLIGNARLIQADQKKYPYVENTSDNYRRLLMSAYTYNTKSDNSDTLVAVVTASEEGNDIRVEIREKNEANTQEFQNQYSTAMLNERLRDLLSDLGVSIRMLENHELTSGYVDFSKASSIADGFAGLINIANGLEGEAAFSEEFAHLLIGMFRDQPLVQRSLTQLLNNDELIVDILGDEYDQNARYYAENPNYNIQGDEMSLEESLAEEALARLLQTKMRDSVADNPAPTSLNNLLSRFITWLKRIFKGRNADDFLKAKNEVNTSIGELAKQILNGERQLTKEDLAKSKRNARFNHLRNETDKVLALLKNADEIERKRSKISQKDMVGDIHQRITKLEALMTDRGKMEGLFTYAKWALSDLQNAMNKLTAADTLNEADFTTLRHIKSVLDSYTGFISDFHDALDSMGEDVIITINGQDVNMRELWRDINDLYQSCYSTFKKQAFSAFSDFLAPIYEKSPLRNEDGSVKPLNEVLEGEDFDISEFDRWMTSMGESSSVLLQLFDKVVKNAKDKVRIKTISNIREIWKLRDNAEKRGITSFGWMFETDSEGHKTGNYISPRNKGQYEKDKEAMLQELKDKYGERPTEENYKKARAEKKAWFDTHAELDEFGNDYPEDIYRNPEYEKLSQAQKDTLNEFLEYKDRIERLLPPSRRSHYKAIQRRRSTTQRISDAASNVSQTFDILKEDLKSLFGHKEDDYIMYGERTQGLTDFTGQEYMTLPILYTGKLSNPDELSTDIFSDLMAYTYMANNYVEMSGIYDPLEIGVTVTADKEFVKRSGTKIKEETLRVLGRVSHKSVKVGTNTSFAKKLRDYLECQVYGRYMKEDDIFGTNTQKTISLFQRLTSMAYLGCNLLAGVANVANAFGMQHIEAAASEFFSPTELLGADKEYWSMISSFIAELGSRSKESKLALFDELFDVKQNVKDRMHNTQMKSIFRKFFGNNWLFIQQGMGDHWVYNRTAIAMAKHKRVSVNGREMSLWDALEIVTDDNGYKKMQVKPGTKNIDGSEFEAGAFSREIAHINHTIAGIYNDDDQNAANRVVVGRLAMQMRKWIVPLMMRRFQSKRVVLDIGKEEEGYYRTAFRLARDMWKSEFKIKAEWDKLSTSEKANVRRAITEILQTYSLWLLATLLGSGVKDPDRFWAAQFAEYLLHREVHELGFLTPGHMMFTEGYKTITSPFVCASAANKVAQAIQATMNPKNWFLDDDELIQSGRYEGHGPIYKRWAELPLPPMTQIRQIEKFVDDLDTGTKYYNRDYK